MDRCFSQLCFKTQSAGISGRPICNLVKRKYDHECMKEACIVHMLVL